MTYGYSIKEIIKFTIPMVLNVLVMNLMFTVDRLFLTKYSLDSMNAAALGGSFSSITLFLGIGITQVANIFVGQYNGAKEYLKIGRPVWQMIYFSLILIIFFVPLGYFCDHLGLFPPIYFNEGVNYLSPLLIFGWLPALSSALAAFFIGRGKSTVVIMVFFLGNIINCFLDFILIFGVNDIIPAMGAKGAAYATIMGEIFFIISFATIFLKKNYREKYGTLDYKFRLKLFCNCIKVGFPLSMGMITSQIGWLLMMICFSKTSRELATCESIGVLLWMFFIFCAQGCARSLTALSSNLIGKGLQKEIENLLMLFLKSNICLFIVFSIPLIFYQDFILNFVIDVNDNTAYLRSELSSLMVLIWFTLLLDGMYYLICGVLNAGGDTKFPMFLEISSLWIIAVIPTLILFFTNRLNSIIPIYVLICTSQLINVTIIYYRYKQKKWFKRII